MALKNRFPSKKVDLNLLLLGFALLVGLILRLNNLGGAAFWSDEMHQAWTAKNILEGEGVYHPDNPDEFYSRGLLTTTLPAMISFRVLGYSEFAGRLPSVLVGMMSIVVVYILCKELVDGEFALISSFMLSLSYWAITWHTQLRMYAHLQLLYVLSILIFYKWFEKDFKLNNCYPYLLGLFAIIGYQTHLLYLGIFAVFSSFIIINLVYEKSRNDTRLKESLGINSFRVLVFFALAGLVFILIEGIPGWFYGHTPEWYSYDRTVFYYLFWINNYVSYLFLFAAGVILSFGNRNYWIISLSFLIPFISQSILFEYRMPRLIFHIYPFFLMMASLPIYHLYKRIESISTHTKDFNVVFMLLAVIAVVLLQSPWFSYSQMSENSHGMYTEHQDYRGPVNYIQQNIADEDVLVSEEPIKTDWYADEEFDINYGLHYREYDPASEKYGSETPIITRSEKFEDVISSNSGFLIVSDSFLDEDYERMNKYLENNIESIIQEEEWGEVIIIELG